MDISNQEKWLILPKDIIPEKEFWEQVGFQFLEIENNNISWKVKLPQGWTIETPNHCIWNNILDEYGKIRGKVFDKTKLNSKPTYMSLNSRYSICIKKISEDNTVSVIYFGNDEEKLYVAGQVNKRNCATREDRLKAMNEENQLLEDAMNWANANYPEWLNVNAYWNLPIKQNQKVKTKK